MIIQEKVKINGREYIQTYSDNYLMIERDRVEYSSATDLPEFNNEYKETNKRIFSEQEFDHMPIELREKVLEAYRKLDEA